MLKSIGGVAVSWVYDRNRERSKLLSSMYGVDTATESALDKALDEIDLCVLAVPYASRSGYIEMCAAKGKAMYVEKPFATTVAEHQRYCKLFPSNSLAVGYQRRYHRIVATLASVIESGVFGALEEINFRYGAFHLKGGADVGTPRSSEGRGVTIESAVHSLDQILVFTGATAVEVLHVKSLHRLGVDYDSKIVSEIVTPSAKVAVNSEISCLRNLGTGLELHFERAVIRCGLSHDATISVAVKGGVAARFELDQSSVPDDAPTTIVEAFFVFWTRYLESLSTGRHNLTLAQSSVLTTHWLEQIYGSMGRD
ncbi:Gfo/Idh/MocA family oxidoreductase [Usitatibacter rugosus]|uniref:Gfo/Idh/MocA family protein n=1 Tax=Usitatibacter rugosus TaxID=2732067 RepID=UPI001FEA2DF3